MNVNRIVPNGEGIAVGCKAALDKAPGAGGNLPQRTERLSERLKSNRRQQDTQQPRLEQIEAHLRRQYSALDEVGGMLATLRDAWDAIEPAPTRPKGAGRNPYGGLAAA